MKEPVDLRELVGGDLPPDELEELSRVDGLLRSVPAPPHDVPASLTQAVAAVPLDKRRPPTRRRIAVAVAFAALIAVAAFGLGRWTADDFSADYAVELEPTPAGPSAAAAVVEVGERDPDSGNVELLMEISGLPKNADDEFYALWLEKDGEWAATCGYFSVGEGETTVRMTVSYEFRDFDAWNISLGVRPDAPPPLLAAEIPEI
jgi:Anti-sigma-K factor rskA